MNTRPLLAGAVLLLASALPATAQVAPGMGPRPSIPELESGGEDYDTQETIGAGRQMGSPEGDALTRPADPSRTPAGPGSEPRRGAAAGERMDEAATNVLTPPTTGPTTGNEGTAGTVAPADRAEQPADLNEVAPQSAVTTAVGGGALAEHQIYAQDLAEYAVIGPDGGEVGDVAGVVLDMRSGRLDALILSRGGFAGVGDTLLNVPWSAVTGIDRNAERLYVDADEAMLRSGQGDRPDTAE